MASIHLDDKSGYYRIRFRCEGRQINRSLKTSDKRRARSLHAQIEETIELIERGRVEIPTGIDPAAYILSDGQLKTKSAQPKAVSLTSLFATYEERLRCVTRSKSR